MLFTASWFIYTNPEFVESVIDSTTNDSEEATPVSLIVQSEEKWLVLLIDLQDKPAKSGSDLGTVQLLLNRNHGVSDYLSDMAGGTSMFEFDIHDTILHGTYTETEYGKDVDGIRDNGIGLSGGVSGLALEALIAADTQGVNWNDFDLNSDDVVDRILIVHTGGAQEDGGTPNEIWSHFGYLEEELEFNGTIISTYAMVSLKSNVGTIAHEMLHSFGAADLYAVHDELPQDNWKGVGDFDIMASGNWAENSAGDSRPVLPMAATMNLIGVERFVEINPFDLGSNAEQKFELDSMSNSGLAYRIELTNQEYLWLEYRHKSGIDIALPGSGLLVSIQDDNVGNITLNNVNRNSQNPYLMIVEADENSGLITGSDSGEESDLFKNGSKFGSDGVIIRDRHGTLVPWLIEINHVNNSKLEFIFSTSSLPLISMELISNPVEILADEQVSILINANANCDFNAELFSDDSRILEFNYELELGVNELIGSWDGTSDLDSGIVMGILKCGDVNQLNVKFEWQVIGNRVTTLLYEGNIHFEDVRDITIPLEYEGNHSRSYLIEYVGPLERIAVSPNKITLNPGDELVVRIDPQGLLSPGMYARGEIILHDDFYEHRINIVLQSEFIDGQSSVSEFIGGPAQLFAISLALGGLWFLLSISSPNQNKIEPDSDVYDNLEEYSDEIQL
jgi:M6 family metalloprotease-like protein